MCNHENAFSKFRFLCCGKNWGVVRSIVVITLSMLSYSGISQSYDQLRNEFDSIKNVSIDKVIKYGESFSSSDSIALSIVKSKLAKVYFDNWEIEKAKEVAENALTICHELDISIPEEFTVNDILGRIYFRANDFKSSSKYFKEQYCVKQYQKEIDSETIESLYKQGIVKMQSEDYYKAKEFFDEALRLCDLIEDGPKNRQTVYNHLAALFTKSGMLMEANDLTKFKLDQIADLDSLERGLLLNTLGIISIRLNNGSQAIEYLEESIRLKAKYKGPNHLLTATAMYNAARAYLLIQDYESFEENIFKALDIFEEFLGKEHIYLGLCYQEIAYYYYDIKDFDNSIKFAEDAIKLFNSLSNIPISSVVDSRLTLSKCYIASQNYNAAQENLDSIRVAIGYEKNEQNRFNKLRYKKALFDYLILLENLQGYSEKADIFNELIYFTNYYQGSYSESYTSDIILEKYSEIYERAINYWLTEGTKSDLGTAFNICQQSKANLLRSNVEKRKLKKYQNINLLTNLKMLDKEISQKEHEFIQSNSSDSILQHELQTELIESKLKKIQLIDSIKIVHPEYFNVLNNQKHLSVREIQEELDADESLLEYFVGSDNLIIFLITQDTAIHFVQDFLPGLNSDIITLRNNLNRANITHESFELLDLSKNLYLVLVEPIKQSLTKKVNIVPDGLIGLVPFDILVNGENDYLIKQHELSYHYSSSYLFKENKPINSNNNSAIFAPRFAITEAELPELNRSDMAPLLYNIEEVELLNQKYFDASKSYIGKNATKKNFYNSLNAQVLHVATHGHSIINDPNNSYIILGGDSARYDYLYSDEFLNMELTNELVVLSACNTGLGKFEKGNGINSLASNVLISGARSVVYSLWSINDRFTMVFMESFYDNLFNGMDKSEALRKSKLKFINHPIYSHPFYWSSFQLNGDSSALEHDENNGFYVCLFSLVSFVLCLLYFRTIRKS